MPNEKVKVQIKGITPLLMHNDNIDWADYMERWKEKNNKKKLSKAGDDRTPGFRWIGSLYHDNEVITIPVENLMRTFMEGAKRVLIPGAKNSKTFKLLSQTGLFITGFHVPLLVNGKTVQWGEIEKLIDVEEFAKHEIAAQKLGFELHKKRSRVGTSKHIRVRPKFDHWALEFDVEIREEQIKKENAADIIDNAGRYAGLGDWRPGAPYSPGSWGMFKAEVA